jgi:hypothetical protein
MRFCSIWHDEPERFQIGKFFHAKARRKKRRRGGEEGGGAGGAALGRCPPAMEQPEKTPGEGIVDLAPDEVRLAEHQDVAHLDHAKLLWVSPIRFLSGGQMGSGER